MKTSMRKPAARKTTLRATNPQPRKNSSNGSGIGLAPLVLKMKSILVPVDFSAASEKAIAYAVPLAMQSGAKITLLHIMEQEICPHEFAYVPEDGQELIRISKARLALLATRKIAPELLGRTLVHRGVPFDEITTAARELNVDLIVIKTHGYTGFKHILMGSTAERVVRHAPCPVLVVRQREHDFV